MVLFEQNVQSGPLVIIFYCFAISLMYFDVTNIILFCIVFYPCSREKKRDLFVMRSEARLFFNYLFI